MRKQGVADMGAFPITWAQERAFTRIGSTARFTLRAAHARLMSLEAGLRPRDALIAGKSAGREFATAGFTAGTIIVTPPVWC